MIFGSVCSGIEAASVAWHPLGWRAAWLAEIEPFPSAVLAHHYPSVPNLGDMTKIADRVRSGEVVAPDVFCGGTPCQAFSVAGMRKSLDDARGNLSLTFCEIANEIDSARSIRGEQPAIVFWENVPGVLNTKDNAFGCFLAGLAGEDDPLVAPRGKWSDAGYVLGPQRAVAWRVLNAQYFGVAQRRRRVFVVASARPGFDPAQVLFEFDGVRRDFAPRREAREEVAGCLTSSAGGSDENDACSGHLQPVIMAHGQGGEEVRTDGGAPCLTCNHEAPIVVHGTQDPCTSRDTAFTLGRNQGQENAVCVTGDVRYAYYSEDYAHDRITDASGVNPALMARPTASGNLNIAVAVALRGREGGATAELGDEVQNCLRASSGGGDKPHVLTAMQVRRLTVVECERMQGFPTVSEKITIQACLDHQNQSVRVALKCLRWQNSALSAEESALTQPAKTAAVPSITSPAHLAPLAALHVRMHSVDELLEIRSAGRLIWSASGAGQSERSLPPTLTENSVQELARLLREAARTITAGKAASPPPISLSFPASSGATSAEKFGRETEVSASGAMNDQSRGMFTTSDLGLITMYSGSTVETLCCSALRAIAGCIPNKTLPETFSIELTVETPYTAIPWRKKPASECPDGPRYKALGNSWAVPNVAWIGRRIDDAVKRLEHANDNNPAAEAVA